MIGWVGGRVVDSVGRTETAYVHRGMTELLRPTPVWANLTDAAIVEDLESWTSAVIDVLEPHTPHESYQNFPNRAIADWPEQYFAENLPRLNAVKAKWGARGRVHVRTGVGGRALRCRVRAVRHPSHVSGSDRAVVDERHARSAARTTAHARRARAAAPRVAGARATASSSSSMPSSVRPGRRSHRPADERGQVVVADADRVGVAVRALGHLGGGPHADARDAAQALPRVIPLSASRSIEAATGAAARITVAGALRADAGLVPVPRRDRRPPLG